MCWNAQFVACSDGEQALQSPGPETVWRRTAPPYSVLRRPCLCPPASREQGACLRFLQGWHLLPGAVPTGSSDWVSAWYIEDACHGEKPTVGGRLPLDRHRSTPRLRQGPVGSGRARMEQALSSKAGGIAGRVGPLNALIYSTIFLVTQVAGLLLSLVICFVLQDFIWGFVRMALMNSLILGSSLVGSCYLTQKLAAKMKIVYIAALTVPLILGVSVISFLVVLYLEPALFIYYDRGAFAFLFVNLLFILALHVISSGLIFYREVMVTKEKAIGTERYLKNQMELQLLSSKVNPHFLFNTLNMILTLLKQPEKAETAILNLSDLLRHNLEQSEKGRISAQEEIENVRKYLEIQALRFGDKLHYSIEGDAGFEIPPLIIQPLVENSIKHNIKDVARLNIQVQLQRDGIRNTIRVFDSERKLDPSMLDKGQGLAVTRKRVESSNGTFAVRDGGIEISFGL
ncbi:MAG: hypothetical protein GF331_25545 [Chitinivibrionales bacterium]|nr:hypothetical protein [Chitinivibrionales bacterium]